MPHWKLTLAYDGTTFHDWQVQPSLPTIQGTLAAALLDITSETTLPQGSGRTDAGVHALAQVASVTLQSPIPSANLHRALNRILPPSIRILSAEEVPATFHARLSARQKTYEYRIFERGTDLPNRICSPFQSPYVWDCRFPLNLAAMQQAALDLLGTHDFTSFAASDPDITQRDTEKIDAEKKPVILSEGSRLCEPQSKDLHEPQPQPARQALSTSNATPSIPNPIKTIHATSLTRTPETLTFRITGSGFLHHMVRNIVGTLVEIGRGAYAPDCIPKILAARDRKAAGPTAPARGLFLVSVDYGQPLPGAPHLASEMWEATEPEGHPE